MLARLAVATAILVTATPGCQNFQEDMQAKAHTTALSTFDCPDLQMTTVYEDPRWSWGTYRATGCHATALYYCKMTRNDGYTCSEGDYTSVSSTLTINGDAFVPDGENMCRSGQTEGKEFYGIDLEAPGGDTVRLIQNPDLSVEVVAIASGAYASSSPMKDCATLQLRDAAKDDTSQGLTGSATIDCSAGPWVIKGEVTFQGCN